MPQKKMKDWFDHELVRTLSQRFEAVSGEQFDGHRFRAKANDGLESMGMMDRVRHISSALDATLSGTTKQRMNMLIETMGETSPSGQAFDGQGYTYWPYAEFIAKTGLDDWDASFRAMTELTQRHTSEFAVRPFLASDIDETFSRLKPLISHSSPHVRRWVSEGTRTRLPWAKNIEALYDKQQERIDILDALKDDKDLYVRRSVANHLQDILKDDSDNGDENHGLDVLEQWKQSQHDDVQWVCKHAARGFLKQGHPRVMNLFGFSPGDFRIDHFSADSNTYQLDDTLSLALTLTNQLSKERPTRIDWVLDRPTAAGNRSTKTFRWKTKTLEPGETHSFDTNFKLIHRSTRTLAKGEHRVAVKVNGETEGKLEFRLEV